MALVSDAGTPLVSDPGYKLVRDAIAAGIEVFAVPGPSAALAGLLVSGLPTDRFFVAGFLPTRRSPRRRAIAELAPVPGTLIVFEAARRLPDALATSRPSWGRARGGRARADQALRGGAPRLARRAGGALWPSWSAARRSRDRDRAAGTRRPQPSSAELDELLAEALESRSPAAAAAAVAAATGQPRRGLYRRALALQGRRNRGGREAWGRWAESLPPGACGCAAIASSPGAFARRSARSI